MSLPSSTPPRERPPRDAPAPADAQPLARLPRSDDRAGAHRRELEERRERRREELDARRGRIRRRRAVAAGVLAGLVALVAFALAGGGESEAPRPNPSGGDEARRPPPSAAPAPARITEAGDYARERAGNVSFAVVDTAGRLHGLDTRRPFASASVVKGMILVAYLDLVERRGTRLTDAERAQLSEMIRRSDNASATQLAGAVGSEGLRDVARRARMRDTRPQAAPWGLTETTAGDQARLFARIDELVPTRYEQFTRRLLSSIVPEHRWGIPRAVPGGSTVLFKGGWLPDDEGAWRVHQAARIERGDRRVALAVMTGDNPSQPYGQQTVGGIARRLLR